MYINRLSGFRVKRNKSEWFRIYNGMRQSVSCPLGFSIYGCSDESVDNQDGEQGSVISGGGGRLENAWSLICG